VGSENRKWAPGSYCLELVVKLVQLPGQVLSSYSSKVVESKFVLNVNNKINLFSGHSKIFHRANFNDSVLVRTNATMVRL
jgi:hypothetical protein